MCQRPISNQLRRFTAHSPWQCQSHLAAEMVASGVVVMLKDAGSSVTCLRNEDVHDHWGSSYDSAAEMTLQAARKEYVR